MKRSLLIAGGGTGGHIFPALAVAQQLRAMDPELRVALVATGKALERQASRQANIPLELISAKAFRGQALWGRLQSLAVLPGALAQAVRILNKYRPGAVLAVGGYTALPLGLAAAWRKVPLLVQEQNAVPGLTNRLLSRFCREAYIAFPEAGRSFRRALLTGNPIRPELLQEARLSGQTRRDPQQLMQVLILGGSQGAGSLNRALKEALPLLAPWRERLRFVHQTGFRERQDLARAYEQAEFSAEVKAFFPDMGRIYGQSHLMLCRSGAGTLSEIMAVGRASVCVPYPFAAGDHQTKNALALVERGAAQLLPDARLNGAAIRDILVDFLDSPWRLAEMEDKAAALGKPEAAAEIARRCLQAMKD